MGLGRGQSLYPDLRVLSAVKRGSETDPLLDRLLPAYGIARSDVVMVDHPVRIRSALAATAMWHNYRPHFVHPGITDVWSRITRAIVDPAAPTLERIFVSRSASLSNRRACRNGDEVERLFESYGFTVIFPEDHDLAVQAGMFRSAKVIAGFGGSAMFNLMFAEKVEHLIVLNHDAYTARNEHLFSAIVGCDTDFFWSAAEIPQIPGVYSSEAFNSSWTFDFERNQEALEAVLRNLD